MNKPAIILVAEDEPTDAFFLERAFKRAGVPVILHFVADGRELIAYLKGEPPFADRAAHPFPQLLLLDLNLPRMSGFEVLSWIRKKSPFKDLQVVIFSASQEPQDIHRAQDLGANSYLVKPHSIDELNELVGRFKKEWLDGDNNPRREAA